MHVTAADLLTVPRGTRTEAGLRHSIRVGVQYLEAWLRGVGCVPLYNLMEDAATAEISRTQIWQWIRHGAALEDGRRVTAELFRTLFDDETSRLGDGGRFPEARELFASLSTSKTLADFLTVPAYDRLLAIERGANQEEA